ncbi:MAG: non-homologous end-joining DNA ligase [Candidatus Babeliales bacterium]
MCAKAQKKAQPTSVKPMLATLTKEYFSRDTWIYEPKFDGERCIAIKKNGSVSLVSRNNKSINDEYPELAEALTAQKADNFIIDGEIIAVNNKGISDFQLLQSRINLHQLAEIEDHVRTEPVFYCIFDVLYTNGADVRVLPLIERKALLKSLLHYNHMLLYTQHIVGQGVHYLKKACKQGWEGLIAKKIDSRYVGKRSRAWLKFKCSIGQELVIGGYTEPQRSRTDFGALLVGYYKNGSLHFAGKVGTGFSQETLTMLGKKLRSLEIKTCPFDGYEESMRSIHWVKPVLVAEFEFAQWTKGNKLRVPRYKGLRTDKAAREVVQELPK